MTRAAMLGVAVCLTLPTLGYWHSRDTETFLPVVWPIVFGFAGVATALAALTMSRRLMVLSGALTFVAVLSRAAGIVSNLIAGNVYLDSWRAVAALGLFPLGAGALAYVWRHGFIPWSRVHRP